MVRSTCELVDYSGAIDALPSKAHRVIRPQSSVWSITGNNVVVTFSGWRVCFRSLFWSQEYHCRDIRGIYLSGF